MLTDHVGIKSNARQFFSQHGLLLPVHALFRASVPTTRENGHDLPISEFHENPPLTFSSYPAYKQTNKHGSKQYPREILADVTISRLIDWQVD